MRIWSSRAAAGPYSLNLRARGLHIFADLLGNTAVTRAAASAALHLMRHSKTGANRDVNRTGLVGVSIVWKRGWTHAEGHERRQADYASI